MARREHRRVDPARCTTCSPTFCESGLCADPATTDRWPLLLVFTAFALVSALAAALLWSVFR